MRGCDLYINQVENTLRNIIDKNFTNQETRQYYNEAQVQHKLAIELYKRRIAAGEKEEIAESTLEWFVGKENDTDTDKYIDMAFDVEGKIVAVELKYKTRKVKSENGKEYFYKNQLAQNNTRFDFLKDIQRLETLKSNGKIEKGFAILITNDHLYWKEIRTPFSLHEGQIINARTYTGNWKDRKGKTVIITQPHVVHWTVQKNGGVNFSYVIVPV